ncbi:MAG: diguanylate cyclase [Gemmatimonadota bacterium]
MPTPDPRPPTTSIGERYRVLLEIGRTLAGTLSTYELYEAIYRETARVLEAAGFFISIYDAETDLAQIVFFADRGEVQHEVNIQYPGKDSEVLRTRSPVLVDDRLQDRSLRLLGDDASEITRSAISAPMIHKGELLGAISAQSYRPHEYRPEDLDLLQGIADIAAVAVDNALHVAELEARRREAEQVEEIGRALVSALDPDEVLKKVVEAVVHVLSVDGAAVWLRDGDDGVRGHVAATAGQVNIPEGIVWDLSSELADHILLRSEPVVLPNLLDNEALPSAIRDHVQMKSAMGAPLVVEDRVVGLLTAASAATRLFTPADVGVLQRLANQGAVALENARLHQSLQSLSLTDPLTGLPNRRRLFIHLDKEVAAARRGRSLVVVVFDLDDFKRYNDTLGHLVGDDILRAFGQILHEENRAMNLVARYGGDEFVSILSESNMDGVRLYVDRIQHRVREDPIMSQYGVSVSIGLAEFDRTSMKTMDDVIQAADADMYRAKSRHHAGGRKAASP